MSIIYKYSYVIHTYDELLVWYMTIMCVYQNTHMYVRHIIIYEKDHMSVYHIAVTHI